MLTKLFEVRDAGTFIPCIATMLAGHLGERERYLVRRAGYCLTDPWVLFGRLDSDGQHGAPRYDPNAWPGPARTMRIAHAYIAANWDDLTSGDVIDVEYILGVREAPKQSERWESIYAPAE